MGFIHTQDQVTGVCGGGDLGEELCSENNIPHSKSISQRLLTRQSLPRIPHLLHAPPSHPLSIQCANQLLIVKLWFMPFLSLERSSHSCPLTCKPGVLSNLPPPWCTFSTSIQDGLSLLWWPDCSFTKSSPNACLTPFLFPTSPKPFRERGSLHLSWWPPLRHSVTSARLLGVQEKS